MPTVNKIVEGINIINSYYSEDGYNLEAEHDIIFMAATDQPIGHKDLRRLIDIGFFQENLDEDDLSTYNIEEHWQLYV